MPDISINVTKDTASATLENLRLLFSKDSFRAACGRRCVELTASYVRGLGTNKMGWPSTGFYRAVAGNVRSQVTDDGFSVMIDHPEKPGAMRQRYHGGTIRMIDKLLTIPARAQFYGKKATDFTDLRFVQFASGAKALVVGSKGAGLVNFGTGKATWVKGTRKAAQKRHTAETGNKTMVAYWLRESVDQDEDHGVVPSNDQYLNVMRNVFIEAVAEVKGLKG